MNTTRQHVTHLPTSPWCEVRDQELAAIEGGGYLGDLPVIVVKAVQAILGSVIIGDPVPTPGNLA